MFVNFQFTEAGLDILQKKGVKPDEVTDCWEINQRFAPRLEGGDMRDALFEQAEIIKIKGSIYTLRLPQGIFEKDTETGRLTLISD